MKSFHFTLHTVCTYINERSYFILAIIVIIIIITATAIAVSIVNIWNYKICLIFASFHPLTCTYHVHKVYHMNSVGLEYENVILYYLYMKWMNT